MFIDIPIRVVNFTSLDTPPLIPDPDVGAGATSLRTRYYAHSETRNHSTDEQLDGESFRLSRRPSGPPGPTMSSSLTGVPEGPPGSDPEVDMVVRKASHQRPEAATKSARTDSSQSFTPNGPTTIQTLVYGQGRARSKTISSIQQSPNSFAKLAQDELLRMESGSSSTVTAMASTTNQDSRYDIANLTPSPSLTASRQPLDHPSNSQYSPDPSPEELTTSQPPSHPGRAKSAPVRHEEPLEQGTRPNAGRSQSETAVKKSPTNAGADKANDVRKRIQELEAKMRVDAK